MTEPDDAAFDLPESEPKPALPGITVSPRWHPDERLAVIQRIAKEMARLPGVSPARIAELAGLIIDAAHTPAALLEQRRVWFGRFIKDALPTANDLFARDASPPNGRDTHDRAGTPHEGHHPATERPPPPSFE